MDMAQNRSLWRMWSTYGATQCWVAYARDDDDDDCPSLLRNPRPWNDVKAEQQIH